VHCAFTLLWNRNRLLRHDMPETWLDDYA